MKQDDVKIDFGELGKAVVKSVMIDGTEIGVSAAAAAEMAKD